MNAQGILNRIEQDARESAAALLQDAQARADAIRAASDARISEAKDEAMEHARQEAVNLDDRMQRMAKLDGRKALLAAKREVLDEAFARALDMMAAMPEETARAFGLRMLLDAAGGNEVIVADEASAWCDDAFVASANAALLQAGKPGALTLSKVRRNLGGGFVLERGGMEINCSFPAALDARRMDLEAEVAARLFD